MPYCNSLGRNDCVVKNVYANYPDAYTAAARSYRSKFTHPVILRVPVTECGAPPQCTCVHSQHLRRDGTPWRMLTYVHWSGDIGAPSFCIRDTVILGVLNMPSHTFCVSGGDEVLCILNRCPFFIAHFDGGEANWRMECLSDECKRAVHTQQEPLFLDRGRVYRRAWRQSSGGVVPVPLPAPHLLDDIREYAVSAPLPPPPATTNFSFLPRRDGVDTRRVSSLTFVPPPRCTAHHACDHYNATLIEPGGGAAVVVASCKCKANWTVYMSL